MKIILIAIAVAVIVTLSCIGLWFSLRVLAMVKSQLKLKNSIDAGDMDAVKAYFEDFAERHNKGMKS